MENKIEYACINCGKPIPKWRLSCGRQLWRATCDTKCLKCYTKKNKGITIRLVIKKSDKSKLGALICIDGDGKYNMTASRTLPLSPKYRY